MRVCLGGTFDPFHLGHERLLRRALEVAGPEGHVFIGLVTDAFSAGKRARTIRGYAERHAALTAWLGSQAGTTKVQVSPLDDPHGPSVRGDYDVLVTSVETAHAGPRINEVRRLHGLAPLAVEVVPYVLGDDLLPISATRVAAGQVDRDGRRSRPLVVAVGSTNPVKVQAVEAAFARFLPNIALQVRGIDVASGVAEQPIGDETAQGAANRARAALDAARGDGAEYAVGIEAGIMDDPYGDGRLDVQHCVILDVQGHRTHGHGAGFHHPRVVEDAVAAGETVGDVLARLSGDPRIGQTQGAIGWLTDGRIDRVRLTRHAVEAALVPRVRRALYDLGVST